MKLILLSGLDGTAKLFEPFIDAIPDTIEIEIIDYPVDKILSYDELVGYVVERLPKHEHFVLLAESFSGYIAYKVALQKPKNLKGVVFVATFLENPRPYLSKILPFIPMRFLLFLPMPTFVANYLLVERKSNMIKKLQEILKSVSAEVLYHRLLEIVNLHKATEILDMKALYIQASSDKLVPKSAYKVFEQKIPHIKLIELKGSHLILQGNALESASEVDKFIKNI
ncbi:MAG: lysophospholipase [Sulfurovum sp.]|nr:lysophospholipase [Sulfurovum sp.]